MTVLEARNITKIFPGVIALNDISISFESGKIHGIVGENGAGKSTLIKVLTGIYQPDKGDVFVNGQNARNNHDLFQSVGYVPQELEKFNNLTVADNLFIPYEKTGINSFVLNKTQIYALCEPWLEKFHITAKPDELVKDISVSNQQLLQIARAMVNKKAQVLLFDEPTTSLTMEDVDRLFKVMGEIKRSGTAVIFISHKLEEVFSICDDVTVLRNGIKVGEGKTENVDIPWTVHNMVGRELDAEMTYLSEHVSDEVVMEVENLIGEGFRDVTFNLHKGEILGFTGLVGAGRSELMQAIFGYSRIFSGKVSIGGKLWKKADTSFSASNGLIYLPEERKSQGIFPSLSVRINSTISLLVGKLRSFFVKKQNEESLAKKIIKAYDIKTPSLDQQIRLLSGGNQQKIIIGRSMFLDPKVLIFDEPTKGIDVGAKAEIYKLMKQLAEEKQIGIILVSSELEEILRCSNRILCMYGGRLNGEFPGGANQKEILNKIVGLD